MLIHMWIAHVASSLLSKYVYRYTLHGGVYFLGEFAQSDYVCTMVCTICKP